MKSFNIPDFYRSPINTIFDLRFLISDNYADEII